MLGTAGHKRRAAARSARGRCGSWPGAGGNPAPWWRGVPPGLASNQVGVGQATATWAKQRSCRLLAVLVPPPRQALEIQSSCASHRLAAWPATQVSHAQARLAQCIAALGRAASGAAHCDGRRAAVFDRARPGLWRPVLPGGCDEHLPGWQVSMAQPTDRMYLLLHLGERKIRI